MSILNNQTLKFSLLLYFLISLNFCLQASRPNYQMQQGFMANKGQVKNQFGQANNDVFYVFQSKGVKVILKAGELSYEIVKEQKIQRIDLSFIGANRVEPKGIKVLAGAINFHNPNNIQEFLTSQQYEVVIYENLYAGIDLECVAMADGSYKYNFIVHPGSDPNQIKMQVLGTQKAWVDKHGNLCMKTISGQLKDELPLSYETNASAVMLHKVEAKFVPLHKNIFGIQTSAYNKQNTLVIDPIVWATYFGGFNYDMGQTVQIDSSGNLVLVGQTYSTTAIATVGAYQTTLGPSSDAFIAKFSPSGVLLWATYFGGVGNDLANDVAINQAQEIILVGTANSSAGLATTGAHQTIHGGNNDGFVAKFSPNGALQWATYLGWDGVDRLTGVCVNPNGDIHVLGNTNSGSVGNFPDVHSDTSSGFYDVFLAKFSSAGSLKWITMFGGDGNDFSNTLNLHTNGNLYFSGHTYSNHGLATPGAYRETRNTTNPDGFVAIFDSTGNLFKATLYGGGKYDIFTESTLDSVGNMYAVGSSNSQDSIATPGTFQPSFYGPVNAYHMTLVKFDANLNPLWGTYIGGRGNDYLYAVTMSKNGYIVCGGNTNSDSLATLDADQVYLTTLNYQAAYIAVFKPDGNRHFASYYNGSTATYAQSVVTDKNNQIYFTGSTNSSFFITTTGAHQTNYGGSTDAYLVKLQINYPVTNLPLSNNLLSSPQQTCGASQPGIINGSLPIGGNGSFTYLWLQSTTGATGLFTLAAGTNNAQNYQPGTIYPQTWYKRRVYSGTDSIESNVVFIDLDVAIKADFQVNKMIQCERTNQFIFTDNSQSSETYTRMWDFDNGNFGSNQIDTQTFAYGVKNYFDVKLRIETTGGCLDSLVKRVFLIGHPNTNTISGLTEVNLFDTASYQVPATAGSLYYWRFKNGIGYSLSASITLKWTKLGADTLYLIEQNSGACLSDTMRLPILVSSGVGNTELAEMGIQIYPNPANQYIYVETSNAQKHSFQLINALGSQVLARTEMENKVIVDASLLPNGIYFLKITNDLGQMNVSKVIIEHE